MKVYFNPSVSVYSNSRKRDTVKSNFNTLPQHNVTKTSYSNPSFGATFWKTFSKHVAAGASTGAAVGSQVGGAVDLGTLGTTLGVPTAGGTAVGSVIGGAGGAITGTISYFVDKKHEAERKKLEEENKKLEKEKQEIEEKQKALAEQEAAATKKNQEALDKQQKDLAEQKRLVEILQSYNTKELNTKKGVGLGKTAGYAEDKAALNEVFISPFRKSFDDNNFVEEEIPNGILLYGLSGNGKTTLAQGMIEELTNSTNTAFYDLSSIRRKDLQDELIKIREKASIEFAESGKRTLILMDEFDGLAPQPSNLNKMLKGDEAENTSNAYLKSFMNDCSDDGITIIATTNYPQNIETPFITNNKRFAVKTVIEPPNSNDMAEILEYYLDGVTTGDINYEEAAKLMTRNTKAKEANYSCSCVKSIADKAKAFAKKQKRLVTQDDILMFADRVKPDLSKKYMDLFKEDFEYVTGSTYEEYLEEKQKSKEQESWN